MNCSWKFESRVNDEPSCYVINAHISLQKLTAIKRQDLNSVEHLENLKSIPVTHMILNISIDFH